MLFWEILSKPETRIIRDGTAHPAALPLLTRRLPYDTRCSTLTRSGKRCRGKVRKGTDFCALHDPEIMERRRRAGTPDRKSARYRLSHLPDGYLRKLSKRSAVGNAMDRLYREVRLGIISSDMGAVLFEILVRLMDSGLLDQSGVVDVSRCKADRLRPKVKELLTRSERAAWKKAVASAPATVLAQHGGPPVEPVQLPLQAAS